jgi:hypothetical protein
VPATQQELPEPMPCAHPIAADVLDGPHQIAEVLVLHARHEREAQLTRSEQPDQPDRVA